MYQRAEHSENSVPVLRDFIRAHPLGTLTSAFDVPTFPLLQSTLVPFVLDFDPADESDLGSLKGHIARANPQAKAMIAEASAVQGPVSGSSPGELEREVLILFTSPAHHYVTPKFYTETKPKTGKVVPTWNYASVEARGKLTIFHDAKSPATVDFLAKTLRDLSNMGETEIMGHGVPWKVEDAPPSYVSAMKKAIIGVQIRLTSLAGRFKLSQDESGGDRTGVVEGFRQMGSDVGNQMAQMVEDCGASKKAEESAE
ncbi:hypothetical protein HDU86_006587 [Geranomyces michiganensis]|nr:hypothetical protein HDU86_006587 [Geranomyces michiganensis]